PVLPAAAGWAARPAVALVLHTAALWAWHLPPWYDAAARDGRLHALEHASFLGTAFLFWRALFRPGPARASHEAAIVCVVLSALQGGVLGALLSFSERPWYTAHLATTAAWGLTPVDDQQLAGVLMWAPAGLLYLVPLGALLVGWFREAERIAGPRRRGGRTPPLRPSPGSPPG
ncbi:MAG: cytochrome c oxidase assembly protein, partial [Gemmatimonadota bacterium]